MWSWGGWSGCVLAGPGPLCVLMTHACTHGRAIKRAHVCGNCEAGRQHAPQSPALGGAHLRHGQVAIAAAAEAQPDVAPARAAVVARVVAPQVLRVVAVGVGGCGVGGEGGGGAWWGEGMVVAPQVLQVVAAVGGAVLSGEQWVFSLREPIFPRRYAPGSRLLHCARRGPARAELPPNPQPRINGRAPCAAARAGAGQGGPVVWPVVLHLVEYGLYVVYPGVQLIKLNCELCVLRRGLGGCMCCVWMHVFACVCVWGGWVGGGKGTWDDSSPDRTWNLGEFQGHCWSHSADCIWLVGPTTSYRFSPSRPAWRVRSWGWWWH